MNLVVFDAFWWLRLWHRKSSTESAKYVQVAYTSKIGIIFFFIQAPNELQNANCLQITNESGGQLCGNCYMFYYNFYFWV